MMKEPIHPGTILRHDCVDELGLSVTKAAAVLGVARSTLSRVFHGHSAVSPEMAIRVSKAFGSRPEVWLKLQLAFDLAQANRLAGKIKVGRYTADRDDAHDMPH